MNLTTWWQELASLEKILWTIALVFSALFLVQTVWSLVGGDTDSAIGDAESYIGEDDGIGNQYFTIKNAIAFFTVFGWASIAALQNGLASWLAILLGVIGGTAMVAMMVLLLRSAAKLKHSGTLNIQNALQKTGETYLPIPAQKGGIGKVQILVQGSLRELDAITNDDNIIPTGKLVKVVDILNDQILVVTAVQL